MEFFNVSQFLLAAAVFIPLERLSAFHPGQKLLRAGWKTDVVYTFINPLIIRAGVAASVVAMGAGLRLAVPAGVPAAVTSLPAWLQFVGAVVTADLGFYAAHRLLHAVPRLWRIHQVHHSIEELDWLAAARVHPFEQMLTTSAMLLPLIALGFSPAVLTAHAAFYFWHSHLLHSNVHLRLGPLGQLIASPAFHHWHHADEREAYDKNFAGQLSIIDRLVGTHYTADRLPSKYGIGRTLRPNYLSHLIHPFRPRPGR